MDMNKFVYVHIIVPVNTVELLKGPNWTTFHRLARRAAVNMVFRPPTDSPGEADRILVISGPLMNIHRAILDIMVEIETHTQCNEIPPNLTPLKRTAKRSICRIPSTYATDFLARGEEWRHIAGETGVRFKVTPVEDMGLGSKCREITIHGPDAKVRAGIDRVRVDLDAFYTRPVADRLDETTLKLIVPLPAMKFLPPPKLSGLMHTERVVIKTIPIDDLGECVVSITGTESRILRTHTEITRILSLFNVVMEYKEPAKNVPEPPAVVPAPPPRTENRDVRRLSPDPEGRRRRPTRGGDDDDDADRGTRRESTDNRRRDPAHHRQPVHAIDGGWSNEPEPKRSRHNAWDDGEPPHRQPPASRRRDAPGPPPPAWQPAVPPPLRNMDMDERTQPVVAPRLVDPRGVKNVSPVDPRMRMQQPAASTGGPRAAPVPIADTRARHDIENPRGSPQSHPPVVKPYDWHERHDPPISATPKPSDPRMLPTENAKTAPSKPADPRSRAAVQSTTETLVAKPVDPRARIPVDPRRVSIQTPQYEPKGAADIKIGNATKPIDSRVAISLAHIVSKPRDPRTPPPLTTETSPPTPPMDPRVQPTPSDATTLPQPIAQPVSAKPMDPRARNEPANENPAVGAKPVDPLASLRSESSTASSTEPCFRIQLPTWATEISSTPSTGPINLPGSSAAPPPDAAKPVDPRRVQAPPPTNAIITLPPCDAASRTASSVPSLSDDTMTPNQPVDPRSRNSSPSHATDSPTAVKPVDPRMRANLMPSVPHDRQAKPPVDPRAADDSTPGTTPKPRDPRQRAQSKDEPSLPTTLDVGQVLQAPSHQSTSPEMSKPTDPRARTTQPPPPMTTEPPIASVQEQPSTASPSVSVPPKPVDPRSRLQTPLKTTPESLAKAVPMDPRLRGQHSSAGSTPSSAPTNGSTPVAPRERHAVTHPPTTTEHLPTAPAAMPTDPRARVQGSSNTPPCSSSSKPIDPRARAQPPVSTPMDSQPSERSLHVQEPTINSSGLGTSKPVDPRTAQAPRALIDSAALTLPRTAPADPRVAQVNPAANNPVVAKPLDPRAVRRGGSISTANNASKSVDIGADAGAPLVTVAAKPPRDPRLTALPPNLARHAASPDPISAGGTPVDSQASHTSGTPKETSPSNGKAKRADAQNKERSSAALLEIKKEIAAATKGGTTHTTTSRACPIEIVSSPDDDDGASSDDSSPVLMFVPSPKNLPEPIDLSLDDSDTDTVPTRASKMKLPVKTEAVTFDFTQDDDGAARPTKRERTMSTIKRPPMDPRTHTAKQPSASSDAAILTETSTVESAVVLSASVESAQAVPSLASSPKRDRIDFRAKVKAWYARVRPEKSVSTVEALLTKYSGREDVLYDNLVVSENLEIGPAPASSLIGTNGHVEDERGGVDSTHRDAPTKTALSSETTVDYRAKVVAHYTKYVPEKLGTVDALLLRHKGKEDELLKTLKMMECPSGATPVTTAHVPPLVQPPRSSAAADDATVEARPTTASASEPVAAQSTPGVVDYRAEITAHYATYFPEKLAIIDTILLKHKGNEDRLLKTLKLMEQTLGSTPGKSKTPDTAVVGTSTSQLSTPSTSLSAPVGSVDVRAEVVAHYKKYLPEKFDTVDAVLLKNKGKDDALLKTLKLMERSIGPPTTAASQAHVISRSTTAVSHGIISTAPESSASTLTVAAAGVDCRAEVVAHYTKYLPEKLGSVDALLLKHKGKEEELLRALKLMEGSGISTTASNPPSSTVQPFRPVAKVSHETEDASQGSLAPEPPAARSTPIQNDSTANVDYRAEITAHYAKYFPEKLETVAAVLLKHKGKEDQLLKTLKLMERFHGAALTATPSGTTTAVPVAASDTQTPTFPAKSIDESGNVDYRSEILAHYKIYLPEKIGTVDSVLLKHKGKEAELLKTLKLMERPDGLSSFSPTPPTTTLRSSPVSSNPATTEAAVGYFETQNAAPGPVDYQAEVTAHYAKFLPEKLATVDALLTKHKGKEEALRKTLRLMECATSASSPTRLVAPHDSSLPHVAPASTVAPLVQAACEDYRAQVVAHYTKYSPDKLGTVDALLLKHKGKEAALLETLKLLEQSSNGSLPATANSSTPLPQLVVPSTSIATPADTTAFSPTDVTSASQGATASASEMTTMDYRAKVLEHFAKYAPEKLKTIDDVMRKHKFKEAELLKTLQYVEVCYNATSTASRVEAKPKPKAVPTAVVVPSSTDIPPTTTRLVVTTTTNSPTILTADEYHRAKIKEHYSMYCPERLDQVDTILEEYMGKEKKLLAELKALQAKYPGAAPSLSKPNVPSPSASALTDHPALAGNNISNASPASASTPRAGPSPDVSLPPPPPQVSPLTNVNRVQPTSGKSTPVDPRLKNRKMQPFLAQEQESVAVPSSETTMNVPSSAPISNRRPPADPRVKAQPQVTMSNPVIPSIDPSTPEPANAQRFHSQDAVSSLNSAMSNTSVKPADPRVKTHSQATATSALTPAMANSIASSAPVDRSQSKPSTPRVKTQTHSALSTLNAVVPTDAVSSVPISRPQSNPADPRVKKPRPMTTNHVPALSTKMELPHSAIAFTTNVPTSRSNALASTRSVEVAIKQEFIHERNTQAKPNAALTSATAPSPTPSATHAPPPIATPVSLPSSPGEPSQTTNMPVVKPTVAPKAVLEAVLVQPTKYSTKRQVIYSRPTPASGTNMTATAAVTASTSVTISPTHGKRSKWDVSPPAKSNNCASSSTVALSQTKNPTYTPPWSLPKSTGLNTNKATGASSSGWHSRVEAATTSFLTPPVAPTTAVSQRASANFQRPPVFNSTSAPAKLPSLKKSTSESTVVGSFNTPSISASSAHLALMRRSASSSQIADTSERSLVVQRPQSRRLDANPYGYSTSPRHKRPHDGGYNDTVLVSKRHRATPSGAHSVQIIHQMNPPAPEPTRPEELQTQVEIRVTAAMAQQVLGPGGLGLLEISRLTNTILRLESNPHDTNGIKIVMLGDLESVMMAQQEIMHRGRPIPRL
ncbi:Aste57867_9150 [Aphanomyces stellatus]|uniref:Aste57867_9150 protein n=1 Tax=Aphanomyces stellatus TaxID=120398 RepID=A0A485KM97_9STRA|nr:hypothetical protein As57867_009114 [Aphanomyces stellatus]VFT86034.1 Aste57867_9150 [Aphanomyces stellatus]